MAVHSFGFDENYRKNISSVLQEKRFRFRCFWNELDNLKKKRNLQQNVNSQVKSHREIAGPDVLLQFWCSFLLLLFSLSLAPFFFTARWLSLRFLRWFSPEPVSYEVPKRAEMESSSFLSPPKTHRMNDIQVKFFGNKKTNMGRKISK